MDTNLNINCYEFSDVTVQRFLSKRFEDGLNTLTLSFKIYLDSPQTIILNNDLWSNLPTPIQTTVDDDGIVYVVGGSVFIAKFSGGWESCDVEVTGDPEVTLSLKEKILSSYREVVSKVDWVYNSDGSKLSLPINIEKLIKSKW